jgi:endonuclease/exonuclease/phosphatase family metal-dependent hydrolase
MEVFRKILHNIFVLLNLLFAFLLLISNLSVFISPEKFWAIAFFGLAYPYLLLINIVFVIFWAIKWNRMVLVSLVVILSGWYNLAAYMQIPVNPFHFFNSKNKSEVTLKIMQYNVRDFYKTTEPPILKSQPDIIKIIKAENPDIVCFQEFRKEESEGYTFHKIIKTLKPSRYFYSFYNYSNETVSGIAIFSKYPIIAKGRMSFSNTCNINMYNDIVVKRDTIRIFNCHLQSIRFLKGDYDFVDSLQFSISKKNEVGIKTISYKLREAFKLRAYQVNHISGLIEKSPYPVILCGDFNDTPVSYTYRRMKGNMSDAFRESGKGIGNTYNGKVPSFRIDYIFHSNTFSSSGYKMRHEGYSDHFPIFCKISMKK